MPDVSLFEPTVLGAQLGQPCRGGLLRRLGRGEPALRRSQVALRGGQLLLGLLRLRDGGGGFVRSQAPGGGLRPVEA